MNGNVEITLNQGVGPGTVAGAPAGIPTIDYTRPVGDGLKDEVGNLVQTTITSLNVFVFTGAAPHFDLNGAPSSGDGLVFESNNISSSAFAKDGDVLTLTATSSTPAVLGPVTFKDSSGTTFENNGAWTEVANTSGDGPKFICEVGVPTTGFTLDDGLIEFSFTASGPVGNTSVQYTLPGGSPDGVTLDNSAPVLTAVSIASDNGNPAAAAPGNIVTLSFTSDDKIQTPPTVTFKSGGVAVNGSVTYANVANNDWTATYIVNGAGVADTQGPVTFTIDYENFTGFSGTQVTATLDGTSVESFPVAPSFSSAVVESGAANEILITASANIETIGGVVPGDFTIGGTVTGGAPTVNTVALDNGKVKLTLSGNISTGDTPNVTFTQSTTVLEDPAGQQLNDFTAQSVTNNV